MPECIWCRGAGTPPAVEHIIPEALGCPDGFVLSGGTVCQACNNGLAHLDQTVVDDFDVLAFMSSVPRKRGRPPQIRSRGNVIGTKGPAGYEISFNMNRYAVTGHDGTRSGAFGKSDRNIMGSFEREGRFAKVFFSVPVGRSMKFVRGAVKIAFSSLTYFLGTDLALSEDFDPVRAFVREGIGQRPVLLIPSSTHSYRHQVWPPYRSESGHYAVRFRLAVLEFCVDLSPKLTLFPMLKRKATEMYGRSGWTYLPSDRQHSD